MVWDRKEYMKKYMNVWMKKYYKTEKGKKNIRKAQKNWYDKHPEYQKKQWNNYGKEYQKKHFKERLLTRNEKRRKVIEHYGNKCACCGETIYDFLTIDHKNNDGCIHRKKIGVGSTVIINYIIKNNYPEDIQILCWNCNFGKSRNGGICPHKDANRGIQATN
jgi:hypothetical protein